MSLAICLVLAMVLDAVLGEPKWLWDRVPHPAILMGRSVDVLDNALNTGTQRRLKGIITMVALTVLAIVLGNLISIFGGVAEILVAAMLLAHKSLVDHVRAVGRALRLSRNDAQLMVARIVGRDTKDMTGPQIARAAIESAAENFSDGVIAPAFWFLVGGLPGLLLYKFTNTADSMIGYRNERYEEFGWAAARFDDLLNLIPARLTAMLFALSHGQISQWRVIAAEARLHRSPNAGWPEAALARGLDVALSGPRSYDGQMRDFPYVNETGRKLIGAPEISAACTALWRSWTIALLFAFLLAMVCT
ncbi:cobalamin biosynthesis protein [Roseovarius albus]|uniref:Cobalamin biosynthesis protein CobD n=1 Tax=Roseovarius albus TaxID=1247867 RepID=A0A1X7A7T9_9RHOB|nr:adenosylcobinamide-phosphate synthase CbiB [Roseovarius albus]SLN72822.1 cobalamin biosynthesis protein [Roseovarius albus]